MDEILEVSNVEVIPNLCLGEKQWIVRGILRDSINPLRSYTFQQYVSIPHITHRFDVNTITKEDIPAVLDKLASLADKPRKKPNDEKVIRYKDCG